MTPLQEAQIAHSQAQLEFERQVVLLKRQEQIVQEASKKAQECLMRVQDLMAADPVT